MSTTEESPARRETAADAPSADRLDTAGGWASSLCALHCALLPIGLATLPGMGLELLDNGLFDRGFALGVSLFGGFVFATNLSRERAGLVLRCYALAALVLMFGGFGPVEGIVRGLILGAGGATMALAHFINRAGIRASGSRLNLLRGSPAH